MKKTRNSKENSTPTKENIKYSENPKNVFLIKDSLLKFSSNNDNENSKIIQMKRLRHPGTEESAYFIIPNISNVNSNDQKQQDHEQKDNHQQVFEIMEFNQKYRSWFINESVTSNGRLYITLPIDSLFFGLYYIKKQCEIHAKPLEQLEDNDYPQTIDFIINHLTSEKLIKIADEKDSKTFKAYKYNHDKTMKWLKLKIKYLAYILKLKNINTGVSATSANYTKGNCNGSKDADSSDCNESDYLQLACEIIGAYITTDLYEELKNSLGITNLNKRKSLTLTSSPSSSSISSENKRIKIENNDILYGFDEIKSPPLESKKEKKQTTKEKSLAKAATGTKNISSFFQKKNK